MLYRSMIIAVLIGFCPLMHARVGDMPWTAKGDYAPEPVGLLDETDEAGNRHFAPVERTFGGLFGRYNEPKSEKSPERSYRNNYTNQYSESSSEE